MHFDAYFFLLVIPALAVLAAVWWRRRQRRNWRPATRDLSSSPSQPIFEHGPAIHHIDTHWGTVAVTHAAMHDSCVTGNSLHPAISAVANAALDADAWRIVLDIPPHAVFFRRFFWFLRALARDASQRGGLLIVRYAPASSKWFAADDSPFYRVIPIGELESDLRLAAEREPWTTPQLDEL